MDKDEAIEKFGFDPTTVGMRHKSWSIEDGNLCVYARDGGDNDLDKDAETKPNHIETVKEGAYRKYYFKPLGNNWPTWENDD